VRIVVAGAGGHAKVVIDAARAAGHDIVAVLDERTDIAELLGATLVRSLDGVAAEGFVVALGDNRARRERFAELTAAGLSAVPVVHPDAVIAESATIGAGSVVFAGVVVNPDAVIGDDAILNTGCTVDHDCRIGDHAHIAPGVNLCGNVSVGEGALVGVGSCASPGARIGAWSIVGAGATVTDDVAADTVCVGTPARPIVRGHAR